MTFDFSTFGAILMGKGLQNPDSHNLEFALKEAIASINCVFICWTRRMSAIVRSRALWLWKGFEHPASPFFCLLQNE